MKDLRPLRSSRTRCPLDQTASLPAGACQRQRSGTLVPCTRVDVSQAAYLSGLLQGFFGAGKSCRTVARTGGGPSLTRASLRRMEPVPRPGASTANILLRQPRTTAPRGGAGPPGSGRLDIVAGDAGAFDRAARAPWRRERSPGRRAGWRRSARNAAYGRPQTRDPRGAVAAQQLGDQAAAACSPQMHLAGQAGGTRGALPPVKTELQVRGTSTLGSSRPARGRCSFTASAS